MPSFKIRKDLLEKARKRGLPFERVIGDAVSYLATIVDRDGASKVREVIGIPKNYPQVRLQMTLGTASPRLGTSTIVSLGSARKKLDVTKVVALEISLMAYLNDSPERVDRMRCFKAFSGPLLPDIFDCEFKNPRLRKSPVAGTSLGESLLISGRVLSLSLTEASCVATRFCRYAMTEVVTRQRATVMLKSVEEAWAVLAKTPLGPLRMTALLDCVEIALPSGSDYEGANELLKDSEVTLGEAVFVATARRIVGKSGAVITTEEREALILRRFNVPYWTPPPKAQAAQDLTYKPTVITYGKPRRKRGASTSMSDNLS